MSVLHSCLRLAPPAVALLAFVAYPLPGALRASLTCSPRVLDFGDRGHNEHPTKTLTLENTGTEPVTVRMIRPSCGCLKVSPMVIDKPIGPGERVALTVSMSSGRAMGKLDKYLRITTAGQAGRPIVIPARMRVFDGFRMNPRDFRFDGVCGGEPLTKSVDVLFRRLSPTRQKKMQLVVESVTGAGRSARVNKHFKARVVDIPGGKRIEVTLLPTHPEGRIWSTLHARLEGKPFIVPVAGEMFRWIKIVPKYFNFSRVSRDDPTSFEEEVVMDSTDNRKFKILSMTTRFRLARPKGLRLELSADGGKPPAAALRHRIRARIVVPQAPPPSGEKAGAPLKAQGSFSGKVTVRTDLAEKPEIVLSFFGFIAAPAK